MNNCIMAGKKRLKWLENINRKGEKSLMKEQVFISFDGTPLHLYVFDNVENPKGVVQIAHGMQEYMRTYFEFVEFLNRNDYVVVGFDERAHGKTAGEIKKLGICESDLFGNIVKDQIFLSHSIKESCDLPLSFFGHSYGSFIAQKYIQECDFWDKTILSGSSYMKTPLIKFGKVFASIGTFFKGPTKTAKLIEKMSFKNYQKHFSSGSWITRDEQETKKFYEDELDGTPFSYGFYKNMFTNQLKLYDKKNLKCIDKKKPLFLISGDQDPVGEFSKGITKLYRLYETLGLNVRLKLYPDCRHGLVQEQNKQEVFEDILTFINA